MGAQGTTSVNFGAFPGAVEASVAVTGQTGIVAGSLIEAWIFPDATADHSEDEHVAVVAEGFLRVSVAKSSIIVGTGFTIRAFFQAPWQPHSEVGDLGVQTKVLGQSPPSDAKLNLDRVQPFTYGLWSVAWVWN
jgi:hypothetical protein